MPITQDRILRLLEAAEEYERKYRMLYNTVKHYCNTPMSDTELSRTLLLQLEIAKDYAFPAIKIISEERLMYNMSYKGNARRKEGMKLYRNKLATQNEHSQRPRPLSRVIPTYPTLAETKSELEGLIDNSDLIDTVANLTGAAEEADQPDQGEPLHPDLVRHNEEQERRKREENKK